VRSVELSCGGSGPHLSHILSGFGLLHAAGEVVVRLRRADGYEPGSKSDSTIRAVVDGSHRVVFELRDGADLSGDDLDWCTQYFKRSYSTGEHGDDPRIVPLGLNYPVTARGDWRWRRAAWSALAARPATLRSAAMTVAGLAAPAAISRRLGADPWSSAAVGVFEDRHASVEPPLVLLLTRVWDHQRMSGEKADHWESLSRLRADCIVALAAEFGPRFVGGLAPTPSAVRDFPDLVVDASISRRARYLETMHAASVCVATAGLRGSNGFRLAEYTAAARAIVSEPLHFDVPGSFGPGANYLPFGTVDECVAASRRLVDDAGTRAAMMAANGAYYRDHVRPDALVRNALASLPG
jgi:hypothetical protein